MLTTVQSSAESEAAIRELLRRWEEAFRRRDVDGVMSCYAAGDAVVAYDVVPPLQMQGTDAYRRSYEEFFAMFEGNMDVELRDLRIVAAGEVAFLHCLDRMSGRMQGAEETTDLWLRVTSGLRRIDGQWLIVHDHVSVPTDFETGQAALDLQP